MRVRFELGLAFEVWPTQGHRVTLDFVSDLAQAWASASWVTLRKNEKTMHRQTPTRDQWQQKKSGQDPGT